MTSYQWAAAGFILGISIALTGCSGDEEFIPEQQEIKQTTEEITERIEDAAEQADQAMEDGGASYFDENQSDEDKLEDALSE